MKTEVKKTKEMFVTIFEDETPKLKDASEARKNAAFCCQTGCDR